MLPQLQSLLAQLHSGSVRTIPLPIAPIITSEMTLHDIYALFRLSPGRYPDAIARAWVTLCRALPHEVTVRAIAEEVAAGRLILRCAAARQRNRRRGGGRAAAGGAARLYPWTVRLSVRPLRGWAAVTKDNRDLTATIVQPQILAVWRGRMKQTIKQSRQRYRARRGRVGAWFDGPPVCMRIPPDESGDLHCSCGTSLILFGSTSAVAEEAHTIWRGYHDRAGHGQCRARVAWLARKRAAG